MKNTIKLNNEISINLSKLIESKLLVQANSGGGKSWAIRRIIEQTFGKVQIIVLDPEGEFTNLREKFDFVFAGKDGDAPTEPRSAQLLARRLLELKASAIIDLYELTPQERKHFVRLFFESLVNAPKELWHDCLVILDEAHVFAPEKGESESLGAVIDLASQRILDAIAWLESIGIIEPEQPAVAFLAGYSFGGGAFNNPRGALRTKDLVEYVGNKIKLTQNGRNYANVPERTLTTEELHQKVLSVLETPHQRILKPLLEKYPALIHNDELANLAGYTPGAGAFNNPKGRLRSQGLIEYLPGSMVRAREILFV